MPQRVRQQARRDPRTGPALARLDFLMRYLAWHLGGELDATATALNANLGYRIPEGVPDPEDRLWRDPVCRDLRTVIHSAALDTRRTTGFSLRGTGTIAGLGVHSCGTTAAGDLCWTTAFHFSPNCRVAPAAFRIVDALWTHERWRARESFDFCWLEPVPHAEE
jgi:hypothetical protein